MSLSDDFLGIGRITRSRLDLKTMLDQVVRQTLIEMGAEACVLLLLDESRQTLTLKASDGFNIEAIDAVRLPKDTGVSWRIIRDKRPISLSVAQNDPDYHFVSVSGEDRFVSMLGVPIIDEDDCLGVLYIQSVEEKEYSHEDIATLENISKEVAGGIKVARDFKWLKEKANVLIQLNDTTRQINTTNDMNEILRIVVDSTTELIGARTVITWLTDPVGDIEKNHWPESTGDPEWMGPIREGIVTDAARNQRLINIPDISSDDDYESLKRVAEVSVVCSPMIFEGHVYGVLLVADRAANKLNYYSAFTSEEIQALKDLSQTAAQAVSRAATHIHLQKALDENKQNVRELSILFQLSLAMQRTINLDDLLRVILSCVTVGSGLGFNRAIMLFVNESSNLLQGIIGMGPDSPEDAGRIWSASDQLPQDDLVPWLLARDPEEVQTSNFNTLVRSLRLPLSGDGAGDIVRKVIEDKAAVNVTNPDDLTASDMGLADAIGCHRFAIVPLVARDTALGAILVDNRYNGAPITEADIRLLTRFAAPAAWAIENIRLFQRWATVSKELLNIENQMARVERLSTLGEVAAELAHELKNPLVTIGGFARRLKSIYSDNQSGERYSSIIVDEVERLEKLLTNALDVSKEVSIKKETTDINHIIRDCVDFYWRLISEQKIEVSMNLADDLVEIPIDPTWIKQVVINLILNAIEAMNCDRHDQGRKMTIVTQHGHNGEPYNRLTISDTGGGVADEDIAHIFDPFFTTKSQGTGLGLSLCKKIIRLHHGSLEIDNELGVGVTFTIDLPYKAGNYLNKT